MTLPADAAIIEALQRENARLCAAVTALKSDVPVRCFYCRRVLLTEQDGVRHFVPGHGTRPVCINDQEETQL